MYDVKFIYEHLADDLSKEIFTYRYMYYLTADNSYLRKTALTRKEVLEIYNIIKGSRKKKLIFGAGIWGEGILRTFNDIEFECFVDNKKQLDEFVGKRVISFEEYIEQYRNEMILISSRIYNEEIYKQLKENGISEENIINIGNLNDELNKVQYFDLPELYEDLKKREVFVDAGALDGRTSILFRKWAGENFGKVYTVEPDERNLSFLENNLKQAGLEEYTIVSKGLWDKEDILCFEANGNGVSKLCAFS